MPNQQFHLRDNAFYVDIPKSWDWFFMRNHQPIVFFQDSIHLCTKLRNRLLSSKATMLFGDKLISIGHILQLIGTSSKLNHNLVKCQANHSNANDSNNKFLFPRHHKQSRTIDSKQISSITSTSIVELTVEALENAILQAYSYASRLVCHVNMYEQHQILSLRKMSKLASFQLQKSRIVDYSHLNQHDPDFDSDSDDSSDEEDEDTTGNCTDNEDSTKDDDNYVSDHLFKVSSTTFQGMRVKY
ncbi:unnamed protein product, partial [Rotaria magnacalcarata]